MQNDAHKIPIMLADHREQPSGIPALLLRKGTDVRLTTLATGDYIINKQVIIERKSAEDFIQSLVSNRLFSQCARLARSALHPFLLLEGDPYKTSHQINDQAVKGALLSVIASWQIPVIYSQSTEDSACQMMMLGQQILQQSEVVRLHSYKPKRLKTHRLRFLQGLPQTGPVMAKRLYEHFGSIKAIINANENELQQIDGLGKKGAAKILEFIAENE